MTTSSWQATGGRLQCYERSVGAWVPGGASVDVALGEGGLGWGIGLHPFAAAPGGPKKTEGDGRSPAGVFRLTRAIGKDFMPATKLPQKRLAPGHVCVDDPTHPAYNRLLSADELGALIAAGGRPPGSAEPMVRRDGRYDVGVVVDHNRIEPQSRPTARGAGSCIFMHARTRPGTPTLGGTAMNHAALVDLLAWLDPASRPVLVQLPRDVYAVVREAWPLP